MLPRLGYPGRYPPKVKLVTAQMAERFINEYPRLDVSLLRLYFVSAELPVEPNPPDDVLRCTALWRGYVGTWRLNFDGTLDLLKFTFPHFEDDKTTTQEFDPATATGTFHLTFRPFFNGPNTEIPFIDGHVIEDESQWRIDDQTIDAEAFKSLDQSGLIVRTFGGTAFLPRSLLLEPTTDLATMVGLRFRCEIYDRDDDRGTLILREIEPNNGG